MAVPSTGPVGLSDISAEFGGSPPESLSEYYAGGGLVPSGATGNEGAVPTSGTISINSLRGAVNEAPITATGGTISDSGGYRYHTFTSSGTFTVTAEGAGDSSWNQLEAEILGGGGCAMSGGNNGGGGGGGGGRTTNTSQAAVQSYSIVVGGGGAPGTSSNSGSNGGDSSFNGVTAFGGGKGFENPYTTPGNECKAGGCGGGYILFNGTQVRAPGSQGGDGGKIVSYNGNEYGTGGGGAGGDGGDASGSIKSGNGGSGISMFGVVRGGGGGGGTKSGLSSDRGFGGSGGGGNGGYRNPSTGTDAGSQNGTNGYGGGAGAKYNHVAFTFSGRSGGSGIVIIRYRIS